MMGGFPIGGFPIENCDLPLLQGKLQEGDGGLLLLCGSTRTIGFETIQAIEILCFCFGSIINETFTPIVFLLGPIHALLKYKYRTSEGKQLIDLNAPNGHKPPMFGDLQHRGTAVSQAMCPPRSMGLGWIALDSPNVG